MRQGHKRLRKFNDGVAEDDDSDLPCHCHSPGFSHFDRSCGTSGIANRDVFTDNFRLALPDSVVESVRPAVVVAL
jgi:hypothetical protein